ncbi:MAG: thioredoxin family protein [Chloroflexi bacterium]|nr:thioredoxin family protein [Chloroflexota bacterium]
MMLERLLILFIASLIGIAALGIWRLWLAWRVQKLATLAMPAALAELVPAGPALLYFTTEDCVQCRLQQTPILTQLTDTTNIPVHKFDAVEQETLANFFGIMTVPTTIWLDKMHRPAAINHGLTGLAQLRQQAQVVYMH